MLMLLASRVFIQVNTQFAREFGIQFELIKYSYRQVIKIDADVVGFLGVYSS